jgi:hypothetical protein
MLSSMIVVDRTREDQPSLVYRSKIAASTLRSVYFEDRVYLVVSHVFKNTILTLYKQTFR